jgi:hypothetical protein
LKPVRRRRSLDGWLSPLFSRRGTVPQAHRPPADTETLTVCCAHSRCGNRQQTGCRRTSSVQLRQAQMNVPEKFWNLFRPRSKETVNDPSAGSPTETLLRLLLPLNAQVWESFQHNGGVNLQSADPNTSLKRSIGSSDGRCVQRAGT